jgi:hypothetical protein
LLDTSVVIDLGTLAPDEPSVEVGADFAALGESKEAQSASGL